MAASTIAGNEILAHESTKLISTAAFARITSAGSYDFRVNEGWPERDPDRCVLEETALDLADHCGRRAVRCGLHGARCDRIDDEVEPPFAIANIAEC